MSINRVREKLVKKAFIFSILLLFVLVPSVLCDPSPNITFGFKVNKDPTNGNNKPELLLHFYSVDWETESGTNVNAGRFALNHSAIQEMNMDNSKDLSQPQVIVAFETRYIYSFSFWLKFSPMTSEGSDFKGKYKATVYEKIYYDTYNKTIADSDSLYLSESLTAYTIMFPDDGPVAPVSLRMEFPAMSSIGASKTGRERWMYPISFDFSDYLSSYPAGEYTATITVEVNSL